MRGSSGHRGIGTAPGRAAAAPQGIVPTHCPDQTLLSPHGEGEQGTSTCCQILVFFCHYQCCVLKLTHLSKPSLFWDTKWNAQRTNPTELEFISVSFCPSFAGYSKQVNSWRWWTLWLFKVPRLQRENNIPAETEGSWCSFFFFFFKDCDTCSCSWELTGRDPVCPELRCHFPWWGASDSI